MQDKNNTISNSTQQLPAGVAANDHNIEFVGNTTNKTVIWLQCGNSHTFKNLPSQVYKALEDLFLSDEQAIKLLVGLYPENADNLSRLVEIYTYYMYGQLDNTPDVIAGELATCENFRENKNCVSLRFKHKYLDVNGFVLSDRDIKMIDMIVDGLPDKTIAFELGIQQSTLDWHKKNLFKHLNAKCKTDVVVQAFKSKIAC